MSLGDDSSENDAQRIPHGEILQLSQADSVKWVEQKLETSAALRVLYDHFKGQGFTFYLERAKVVVYMGRDGEDNIVASVLGILPSFVPATAADPSHPAVGITVHDSGYALAASVNVGHEPFGVTDFTLYEVNPKSRSVVSSSVSAGDIVERPVEELAAQLPAPPTIPDDEERRLRFAEMSPGDQGLLVAAVVKQLLADKFSRALFPPEYARSLNMQTPTFQKFAFVTRARYAGTELGISLCSSTSTSSNICTSTSCSGEFDL